MPTGRQEIGLTVSPDDYADAVTLAAIARITGGNVRWCGACSPKSSGR